MSIKEKHICITLIDYIHVMLSKTQSNMSRVKKQPLTVGRRSNASGL